MKEIYVLWKIYYFNEVYNISVILPSIVLTVIESIVIQPGVEMCWLCPLLSEMNSNLEILSELDKIWKYWLRKSNFTPFAYTWWTTSTPTQRDFHFGNWFKRGVRTLEQHLWTVPCQLSLRLNNSLGGVRGFKKRSAVLAVGDLGEQD